MSHSDVVKRKKSHPIALGDLIPSVYPAPEQLDTARVFSWWTRSVPARVSEHARPVKLERGRLTVHVSSAAWAQELQALERQLLRACRKGSPSTHVREIRFRVGKLPAMPPRIAAQVPRESPEPVAVLPEELARTLARLGDDRLRHAIADAAAMSLASRHKPSE